MPLRLLIASDLHDDIRAVELLKAEVSSEEVDAILCPGDFTMMPNPIAEGDADWKEPSEAELAEYSGKAAAMLEALRKVRPSVRLIFVPGNHDPRSMFGTEGGTLAADSENAHGRLVHLAPDLVVAGWGGAVEGREAGQEVWSAYPWREAALRKAGLSRLAAEVVALPPGKQVLLLTHPGPANSSTTWVTGTDPNSLHLPGVRDEKIFSGSASLEASLVTPKAMQERVALQVHGHTHQGCGMARLGSVPVLNPGSLSFTRTYALITLNRAEGESRKSEGPWRLASLEIRTLGSGGAPYPASTGGLLTGASTMGSAGLVSLFLVGVGLALAFVRGGAEKARRSPP
mmetsp:Transcript_97738/g.209714  ORF Transcript_97738/g.209714 Transcript_97738/m.209714 type:complete len:344 (-) Transcript_97738:134-1165(-)